MTSILQRIKGMDSLRAYVCGIVSYGSAATIGTMVKTVN
jgi:hypothetical protein